MLRSRISFGTSSSLAFSRRAAKRVLDMGLVPPFLTLYSEEDANRSMYHVMSEAMKKSQVQAPRGSCYHIG